MKENFKWSFVILSAVQCNDSVHHSDGVQSVISELIDFYLWKQLYFLTENSYTVLNVAGVF